MKRNVTCPAGFSVGDLALDAWEFLAPLVIVLYLCGDDCFGAEARECVVEELVLVLLLVGENKFRVERRRVSAGRSTNKLTPRQEPRQRPDEARVTTRQFLL